MPENPLNDGILDGPGTTEAAFLMESLVEALRGSRRMAGGACPAAVELGAFAGGRLAAPEARRVLDHLSECRDCADRCLALVRRFSRQPWRVFHLPQLRRAHAQNPARTGPALDLLRAWLDGMLAAAPEPVAALIATEDLETPSGNILDVGVPAPPALDQQGRLRIDLSIPAADGVAIRIAIEDEECRLELCQVPVRQGRVLAAVDCSLLGAAHGFVPVSRLRLTCAVPSERWEPAGMLNGVRRFQQCAPDPADVWDYIRAVFAAQDTDWRVALQKEVTAEGPGGAGPVEWLLEQLRLYALIWDDSNQARLPEIDAYLNGLAETLETTHRPRRRAAEAQDASTVDRRRDRTAPQPKTYRGEVKEKN